MELWLTGLLIMEPIRGQGIPVLFRGRGGNERKPEPGVGVGTRASSVCSLKESRSPTAPLQGQTTPSCRIIYLLYYDLDTSHGSTTPSSWEILCPPHSPGWNGQCGVVRQCTLPHDWPLGQLMPTCDQSDVLNGDPWVNVITWFPGVF